MRPLPYTPEDEGPRPGERVVFAAWAVAIALGLTVMITVPLMGR